MRKIPFKNYIYLAILFVSTIIITIYASNLYNLRNKEVSEIYEYSNKIGVNEFDEFLIENPDSIIYIGNKYDSNNSIFEKRLKEKIEELNIKEKFVFMSANKKILNKLEKDYKIKININKTPIILIFNNKNLTSLNYINNNIYVENIIDEEVFK